MKHVFLVVWCEKGSAPEAEVYANALGAINRAYELCDKLGLDNESLAGDVEEGKELLLSFEGKLVVNSRQADIQVLKQIVNE